MPDAQWPDHRVAGDAFRGGMPCGSTVSPTPVRGPWGSLGSVPSPAPLVRPRAGPALAPGQHAGSPRAGAGALGWQNSSEQAVAPTAIFLGLREWLDAVESSGPLNEAGLIGGEGTQLLPFCSPEAVGVLGRTVLSSLLFRSQQGCQGPPPPSRLLTILVLLRELQCAEVGLGEVQVPVFPENLLNLSLKLT